MFESDEDAGVAPVLSIEALAWTEGGEEPAQPGAVWPRHSCAFVLQPTFVGARYDVFDASGVQIGGGWRPTKPRAKRAAKRTIRKRTSSERRPSD